MLIHHPASAKRFTRREFDDFYDRSPDGFGVMWRSANGTVRSRKGRFSRSMCWKTYRSLLASGCTEMVLHWRYATAGPRDDANCHPFVVAGALMMHNGPHLGPSTDTMSDTAVFAERVLGPSLKESPNRLRDRNWLNWLNRRIGGDRLIIWDKRSPAPVIVGEDKGLWYKGRWYSNQYAWSSSDTRPKFNFDFDDDEEEIEA
jgi:hypothetical protein